MSDLKPTQAPVKAPADFSRLDLTTGVMTLALKPTLCTYIIDKKEDVMYAVMTDALPPQGELALANLFSAAPELLSSLQEIWPLFESCIAQGNGELEGDREAIQRAKDAIAKARGGEQ